MAEALLAGSVLLFLSLLAGLSLRSAPAEAAFPGENGKIACHGPKDRPDPEDEGDYEVYTIDSNGGNQTFLTDNPVRQPGDPMNFFNDDVDPSYSPDGRKIAFRSFRSGDAEIWTMDSDGTNVNRVTFAPTEDRVNGWTPDGQTIYFHNFRDGNANVFSQNADGSGEPRRLTTDPALDAFPNGSPDGTKIVFGSASPGNEEIFTMDPDGSNKVRLTDSPNNPATPGNEGIDRAPNYSPDGTQIAFWSTRDGGNGEIYKMNADGTGVTRLTNSPDNPATAGVNESADQNPAWSPDGTKIVFNSDRDGDREVYVMDADGSNQTRLTSSPGTDEFCDWQPIPRVAAAAPAGPPALASGACANRKTGTDRDDTIAGTSAGDRIDALGGHDRVDGLQGDDCLTGGTGRDRVAGALGNDRLLGGADRDSLSGGGGVDSLSGGAAKDKLNGGGNRDTLSGGSGPDQLSGASDNDRLTGGSGNDRLAGGSGRNRYSAGAGNDRVLAANGHNERINCGSGRRDTALADRRDRVRGCERVRRLR